MNKNKVIRQAKLDDILGILKCVEESYKKYIEIIGKKPMPMLADYSYKDDTVYVWSAKIN